MQNQVVRSAGILYFFTNKLLPTILENIEYDIVSTSGESQSSSLENASELTTQMEDNTL